MKNLIQEGEFITITAGADTASGALVAVGDLVGIATGPIKNTEQGEVALSGVYEVPKEAQEFTQGCKVYLNATNGTATTTVSTNKFVGYAFSAAAALDTTVQVKLLW